MAPTRAKLPTRPRAPVLRSTARGPCALAPAIRAGLSDANTAQPEGSCGSHGGTRGGQREGGGRGGKGEGGESLAEQDEGLPGVFDRRKQGFPTLRRVSRHPLLPAFIHALNGSQLPAWCLLPPPPFQPHPLGSPHGYVTAWRGGVSPQPAKEQQEVWIMGTDMPGTQTSYADLPRGSRRRSHAGCAHRAAGFKEFPFFSSCAASQDACL